MVASKCANVVAGAGSVKSSAGTYTAWNEVMEPFLVEVMRSCKSPISWRRASAWLITDGARRAAQERGHFRTGLRETENIVHEQEHVLVFFVAEIFSHRERGQRHAQTRAGRFVHLAVNKADFRTRRNDGQAIFADFRMALGVLLHLDDAGLDHFIVKIVAFARAFADTGEHGNTAVQFGDVVDEFHDDDGFADAGTAESADFAALEKGADEINDLDAGRQNLRAGGLIHERGRGAMDGQIFVGLDGALFVHGIAGLVEHAAHDGFADGHGNRTAGINDLVTSLKTFGAGHGDGAHPIVARCCCTSGSVSLTG